MKLFSRLLFCFTYTCFVAQVALAQNDTFQFQYPALIKGLDSFDVLNFDNTGIFESNNLDGGNELIKGIKSRYPNSERPFLCAIDHKWFVTYSGTGLVFELFDNYTKARRIDRSQIQGFNYLQFAFTTPYYRTIYAMGGYGYWSFNGTLRYFNGTNKTWEIMNLIWPEEEHVLDTRFAFLQSDNKGIYLAKVAKRSNKSNEYNTTDNCYFIKYDCDSIQYIGTINATLRSKNYVCQCKNGIIVRELKDLYLLDFSTNAFWKLSSHFFNQHFSVDWFTYLNKNKLFFIDKERFAVFDLMSNKWMLYPIKASDWQKVDAPLVASVHDYKVLVFIVLGMLLLGICALIFKQRKKRSAVHHPAVVLGEQAPIVPEAALPHMPETRGQQYWFNQLTETERDLLHTIIHNNNQASLDQINRILGVQDKNVSVQKFHRHKIINDLNTSYALVHALSEDLIVRTKSEEDKRIFTYSINEAYLDHIKIGCSPSL